MCTQWVGSSKNAGPEKTEDGRRRVGESDSAASRAASVTAKTNVATSKDVGKFDPTKQY